MTDQVPDILWLEGKKFFIYDEPLSPVFNALRPPPREFTSISACWRGHIATWNIVDDELYLNEVCDGSGGEEEFTIDDLFPHGERKVFAKWFTGRLTLIPEPEAENFYLPQPRHSEHNIVLEVEAGLIAPRDDHKVHGLSKGLPQKWQWGLSAPVCPHCGAHLIDRKPSPRAHICGWCLWTWILISFLIVFVLSLVGPFKTDNDDIVIAVWLLAVVAGPALQFKLAERRQKKIDATWPERWLCRVCGLDGELGHFQKRIRIVDQPATS